MNIKSFVMIKRIIIISLIFLIILIHYGVLFNYNNFYKFIMKGRIYILLYIISWILFVVSIYLFNKYY